MLKNIVLFYSFLLGVQFFASSADAVQYDVCHRQVVHVKNLQIQINGNQDGSHCFAIVSPQNDRLDLIYRSYLFSNEGLFMIFNSYGPGDESVTTGAREFVFPALKQSIPSYEVLSDGNVQINHVSGEKFIFNSDTGELISISNANFKNLASIKPANRGGIEILSITSSIFIDHGFKLGSSPSGSRSAYSKIQDSKSNKCTVQNNELYDYDNSGDTNFKFPDAASLKKFINKRCPKLFM